VDVDVKADARKGSLGRPSKLPNGLTRDLPRSDYFETKQLREVFNAIDARTSLSWLDGIKGQEHAN
jgi:hypothetical protein